MSAAPSVPQPSSPVGRGPASTATAPAAGVMGLLRDHLPLTLLLDLAFGVRSHEVYCREQADVSWVPPARTAG